MTRSRRALPQSLDGEDACQPDDVEDRRTGSRPARRSRVRNRFGGSRHQRRLSRQPEYSSQTVRTTFPVFSCNSTYLVASTTCSSG